MYVHVSRVKRFTSRSSYRTVYLKYTLVYIRYQPIRTAILPEEPTAANATRYLIRSRVDGFYVATSSEVKRAKGLYEWAPRPRRTGSTMCFFEGPFEGFGSALALLRRGSLCAPSASYIRAVRPSFYFHIFASHPPIPSKTFIWAYVYMC